MKASNGRGLLRILVIGLLVQGCGDGGGTDRDAFPDTAPDLADTGADTIDDLVPDPDEEDPVPDSPEEPDSTEDPDVVPDMLPDTEPDVVEDSEPDPDAAADPDADPDVSDPPVDPVGEDPVTDPPADDGPPCDVIPDCPTAPPDHPDLGQPCISSLDCSTTGATCLTEDIEVYSGEAYVSWEDGTCITIGPSGMGGCDPEVPSTCPAGTTCIFLGSSGSLDYYGCLDACSVHDTSFAPYDWNCGCRHGYECSLGSEVCLPGCSNDRECCEVWDDIDDDYARDPGEVLFDSTCTNICDGDDLSEFEFSGCMASFSCINYGDSGADFHSECLFDSECPADSRCLNEIYYVDSSGDPYYPGGICIKDRCELVGRGCGTTLRGECVNVGSSTDPFYVCFATCGTGYGIGDPSNPCRDDTTAIPYEPYACWPYPDTYWLAPSPSGHDGLCWPAVVPDGTDLSLGAVCTYDEQCDSPLGLGGCEEFAGETPWCSVACNRSLAEGTNKICGAAPSPGAEVPGVCWNGRCYASCHTPGGSTTTNGCATPMACLDNGPTAYGPDTWADTVGTEPAGFCFPACVDNAWCLEVFGTALTCDTVSGLCS